MSPTEIESLLGRAFPPFAPARLNGTRGPWSLLGGPRSLGIAVGNDWASLQISGKDGRGRTPLDMLSDQSAWPGGVKYIGSHPLSTLRADVPLLVDTAAGRDWVVRQLRAACDGMLIAAGGDVSPQLLSKDVATPDDPEPLAFMLATGGWSADRKPDGTLRINLQIRGVQRSLILQAGNSGIRVSVALAASAAARASTSCRAAAGRFLLRASAALRWARSFASRGDGQLDAVGFECLIAGPSDEHALLMAVDTLIAACELFGREAELLLEHEELAVRYTRRIPSARTGIEADSLSGGAAADAAAPPSQAAHTALA